MKLNKNYTIAWILWLLAFGVIEYKAIADKKEGDTLSEHVRKLIGTNVDLRTGAQWGFRVIVGIFFAWAIPHFFTGSV